MLNATATIITQSEKGLRVTAGAGRISTKEGSALQIFNAPGDDLKDKNLVSKVLSSGHKSVIEHHNFSIAFNNVSVLTEQFMIEFRLASFTVKSRRYVNFANAGYILPTVLKDSTTYCGHMDYLFECYNKLIALDIPKEDARFVLPYCFRSNFYMTLNGRELIHVVATMLYGRGKKYPEIVMLGEQLKAQFDEIYPGIIEKEKAQYEEKAIAGQKNIAFEGKQVKADAQLLIAPDKPAQKLQTLIDINRGAGFTPSDLVFADRPRELEALQYTFIVKDVSLSCITHFARHRMLSVLIPAIEDAAKKGNYMVPQSVLDNEEAKQIYISAFEKTAELIKSFDFAEAEWLIPYFALSGNVLDIVITMNCRELSHFLRLRCCERAQWEIRALAKQMLGILRGELPEYFNNVGPGCYMYKKCPEGRLSCGKPWER